MRALLQVGPAGAPLQETCLLAEWAAANLLLKLQQPPVARRLVLQQRMTAVASRLVARRPQCPGYQHKQAVVCNLAGRYQEAAEALRAAIDACHRQRGEQDICWKVARVCSCLQAFVKHALVAGLE